MERVASLESTATLELSATTVAPARPDARKLHGRRLPCQIMHELLRLAAQGEGKTRLMYGANISYALLMRYLRFFEAKGYLVNVSGKYVLTDEGRQFSQDLARFLRHFEDDDAPAFLL